MKREYRRSIQVLLLLVCGAGNSLWAVDAPVSKADPAFEQVLAQKIDVDYWRETLADVLDGLGARTGLKSAYPGTLDSQRTFTLEEKGITVRALLEKIAATGHFQIEYAADHVLFW